MSIEACTTPARTKRHYSADLRPDRGAPAAPGRAGLTLCGNSARDETWAGVVVADLPECRRCARSREVWNW